MTHPRFTAIEPEREAAIVRFLKQGKSYRAIAHEVGCGVATIARIKKGMNGEVEPAEAEEQPEPVEAEATDAGDDGMVGVHREYLETLEALRDMALENARLRRVIAGGGL